MTEETTARLLDRLAMGATVKVACLAVGIHPATYYRYVKRNPGLGNRVAGVQRVARLGGGSIRCEGSR